MASGGGVTATDTIDRGQTLSHTAEDDIIVSVSTESQAVTPVDDGQEELATNTDHIDSGRKPDLWRPHSLLINTSDHSRRDAFFSKCFSNSYDILTILISIADIATDVMVLISYYHNDRMTFFWISFFILIIAQIGYILLFLFNFNFTALYCIDRVADGVRECAHCKPLTESVRCIFYVLNFCLLLPFGHLVAFILYFTENEDSSLSRWLEDRFGIIRDNRIPLRDRMSERTRLAIQKLNKHSGFIMEAFLEALPQSILQLMAMVYFEETSIIAVGSIMLSMTSIMTKSLVISQGLEWKSYIWCWLCVCTDFFSIFFIVSWLFLSNEHINGEFLGYFSVIGEVWCWKVMIGVAPFWALMFASYFIYAFWFIMWQICAEVHNLFEKVCALLVFITCGNVLVIFALSVFIFVAILFMEILCFSILAFNLWAWCTMDRWAYTEKHIGRVLKVIDEFISNASYDNNDRIIRILAVNYAYDSKNKLGQWISERKAEKKLNEATYRQIRDNCSDPNRANLCKRIWLEYSYLCEDAVRDIKNDMNRDQWKEYVPDILYLVFVVCTMPIYLLSRIVSIFYPYFIVGYLWYNELWSEMKLFEVVMLETYIGLQALILVLGIFVFRTHLWLWHVIPAAVRMQSQQWPEDLNPFLQRMYSFYDEVQWAPIVREIIIRKFGSDIGLLISDYVEAIELLK